MFHRSIITADTVEPRFMITCNTVTFDHAQIIFFCANYKIRPLFPGDMITSPLRSLLLSHMGDLNSEVSLYSQYDTVAQSYG